MNQPLDRDTMIKVYKYGTYYNPASKHYGGEETTNVVCDRCYRDHLDVCIGWQTHDMCLHCVEEINKELKKPKTPYYPPNPPSSWPSSPTVCFPQPQIMTNMEQSQFRPQEHTMRTRMLQRQFRDEDNMKTYMLQSQFRK